MTSVYSFHCHESPQKCPLFRTNIKTLSVVRPTALDVERAIMRVRDFIIHCVYRVSRTRLAFNMRKSRV